MELIKPGDYIIIQRQKYSKLHKFAGGDSKAILGKDNIELSEIAGCPFHSTFRMVALQIKKRLYSLERCADVASIEDTVAVRESGTDNRNILDNGKSQALSTEEIAKLRETCANSTEIVEQLVENSKTFASKTEYAQEKYLKKKERKYFEYVQVRKPNIRLMAELFYRQDPDKVMGMRIDTLSQLLAYSGVSSDGNFMLYESGTNGLLPAAMMNAIGANTAGNLIHIHPGNIPQKQAMLAMNFPEEQQKRCISVNIYSVLRHFYQVDVSDGGGKRKLSVDGSEEESAKKMPKLEENSEQVEESDVNMDATEVEANKEKSENDTDNGNPGNVTSAENEITPRWKIENSRACKILQQGVDCLVIVGKEYPSSILKALRPFLNPSRPVVVFNQSKEVLMDLYVEMKTINDITNLKLTSNFMRNYQILPNRTHPDVQMNANSGFLLRGYSISK